MTTEKSVLKTTGLDVVYRVTLNVCFFNKYFVLKLWSPISQQNQTGGNLSFLITLTLTFPIPLFSIFFYSRHLLF